ncbi:S8 family serine peptidase [Luteimonas wenzhouensis]|jgi:serine protease|uniref:S8 family serine peptidase n=1 Tax=Luteimonas wenzhouensis TaxID=2599615 RepID=A0A5C5U6N1_9GAMM|nr:S8 family serine peptidase [Luteimonas wenzhouensis]NLW97284.1 S8 family serine peptidase [Xanthomonadaceae bacterium]TWT22101.1 S8 family serine peptidase [Luteimonas wenzhouensis]
MKKRNIFPCTLALALIAAIGATGANAAKKAKFAATPPVLSAQPAGQAAFHRFVVEYRDGTREATDRSAAAAGVTRALSRAGLAGARPASASHVRKLATGEHLVKLSRRLDRVEAEALLRQIRADPNVVSVRPDRMRHIARTAERLPGVQPAYIPNDPDFLEYQWHMLAPDGSPTYDGGPNRGGANVSAAWDLADGNGITIAVLDTGITEHPDIDTSLAEAGYDFITDAFVSGRDTDDRVPGGWDLGDWTIGYPGAEGCRQRNSSWHGTHVAGTAGAQLTDNAVGMAGVAYNARILPVRVLGHCGGYESDITDAIIWAAGGTVEGVPANPNPAHVINLSLGGEGPCSAGEAAAIAQANALGAVVVVAAGNESMNVSNASPANCPGVIAVAANGVTSRRAYYSNFGAGITISAPGGGVYANDGSGGAQIYDGFVWQARNPSLTTPTPLEEINPVTAYGGSAGTSQAAPHVAGVVALMQGARLDAGLPLLTPEEVTAILQSTVTAFTVAPGASQPIGPGIVNAAAAVAKAIEPPCEVDCDPDATPIGNGVALSGLSGAAGSEVLYSIHVPAGAGPLSITTSGGSGDVTLLVSLGEEPTEADAQYRSARPGNNETVRVNAPQAGTYYIKLVGVRAYSNVRLVARHN